MSSDNQTLYLPLAFNEADVRSLCGEAPFAQADILQQAGNVFTPAFDGETLSAQVRGAWQRVDRVNVQFRSGRLQPDCARDGAVFCRHVGALLLQILRDPVVAAGDAAPSTHQWSGAAHITEPGTALAEITELLDGSTVPQLRAIMRRRGLRAKGSKKADIISQLAPALADPAGINAAIADLSPDERLTLVVARIVEDDLPAVETAIDAGFRALGGVGKPPMDTLVTSGLLLDSGQSYYLDPAFYIVPAVVAARLPAIDMRVQQSSVAGGEDAPARLGLVEMLQVIVQESEADKLGSSAQDQKPQPYGQGPLGFRIHPADTGPTPQDRQKVARLIPSPLLSEADLQRLARATGQPAHAVTFVLYLMLELDIATNVPPLMVQRDRVNELLTLAPSERLSTFVQAWLMVAGWPEAHMLFGEQGLLQLTWSRTHGWWTQPIQAAIAAGARLIARLIGHMSPGSWYELDSFATVVGKLVAAAAPDLTLLRNLLENDKSFTLSLLTSAGEEQPLSLRTAEDWSRFLTAVVRVLLTGPLTWLGMVDVSTSADGHTAFRVLPASAALVNRDIPPEAPGSSPPIIVNDDLSVLVPTDTADIDVYTRVAHTGDLIEATAAGLRYQLTPAGMQSVFDTGTSGDAFMQFLAERSGGTVPDAAREAMDRWWKAYGTTRLYDELTLIEFGDDVLLQELKAVSSLGSALVHTFSPRLVAIDAAMFDEVIAELTARGYAPRVVEEA